MISKRDANHIYHGNPNISASGLKMIYETDVDMYLKRQQMPRVESDAMKFGTMVHTALLEPANFEKEYFLIDKIDRRTKAGKEEFAQKKIEAGDRIIVTAEEYNKLNAIKSNFHKNDEAMEHCMGIIELSHYGEFEGVDIRVRPDVEGENFICDLKTTRASGELEFAKEIRFRNYDLQATFYSDVLGYPPENFVFVYVQNVAPYAVRWCRLSDETIIRGRAKYIEALNDWKFYKKTGIAIKKQGNRL